MKHVIACAVMFGLLGPLAPVQGSAQQSPLDPAAMQAFEALRTTDQGDDTLSTLPNTTAGDVVRWLRLRDADTKAPFDAYADFLAARPHWPDPSRIRAGAERAMSPATPPNTVLSFFGDRQPETAQGAIALANVLIGNGQRDAAVTMLGAFWRTEGLDDDEHQALINAYPNELAPHHEVRADAMLWRWRTDDAANELPHMGEGYQALVRARIATINRAGDMAERIALVPDRLRSDPGLTYDRFNLLADRGDWTDATSILQQSSTSADALGVPWRWGSWRRILARWQMREGNPEVAYTLASRHFIAADERNYADLEWLSGYIAYTYLNDPALALTHFERFDAAVETPISKGRAGYWMGRAQDALGNADAAVAAYLAGAQHQTSFYGLLSAEKLGLTLNPDLVGGEDYGDPTTGTLMSHDLVEAGLILLLAGERGAAVGFFVEASKSLDRREVGQLGALLMEIDEPFYTVLLAKSAVRNGIWVQDAYFPLHPMAQMDLPVDPALALAIARQESEFRIDAGSSVGALGLMQLMPGTARDVAGWLDMPYSRARLTTDWEYNVTLGSEYLAFLTRQFGDSPVMIAAGYNAGPGRPSAWIAERGDPRTGFGNANPVDVIDWIEHIPFRETRNYVMRVTEGIPIYRARLSGQIAPVQFTDMLVGAAPLIRPRLRPARALTSDVRPQARPVATLPVPNATAPQSIAGPQPVRPVARAGE